MKNLFFFALLGVGTLASCSTKCPAYSSAKPATQVASPVMASQAPATPAGQ